MAFTNGVSTSIPTGAFPKNSASLAGMRPFQTTNGVAYYNVPEPWSNQHNQQKQNGMQMGGGMAPMMSPMGGGMQYGGGYPQPGMMAGGQMMGIGQMMGGGQMMNMAAMGGGHAPQPMSSYRR